MANIFKHNPTGSESNSIFKGNWAIGVNEWGGGPTSTTGFRNGADIPVGGYAIYTTGPRVRIANNDSELLFLVGKLGGDNSSVENALNWAYSNQDVVITNRTYENIVTEGLVLNLDSGFTASYPKNGTTWYDLSGNGNNATQLRGTWNPNGYWESEYDPSYYGGRDRLRFSVGHSTSLNNTFSTTTGAWSIEEIIRIDDNVYPEAAAGSVVSDSAYSAGQMGFDWNHGVYNTSIQMGIGNRVGQSTGYSERYGWTLPSKFQTLNQWYHRSFYWDRENNEMGVYYNGELIGNADISSVSGLALYDGGGMTIGELYGWCHDGARGNMRVYNRRLSTAEVQQNFDAQKNRFVL